MTPLTFHFLTLFPETISPWLTTSILGRALERGVFAFKTYQLRDYATDRHRTVDDVAYGGGGGMVLKLEPLVRAVESIRNSLAHERMLTIYFSPAGRRLDQGLLDEFAQNSPSHFLFICGHYEGIDQRFLDHWVDWEISLGDFVLTGGELPALTFADALLRQRAGTLNEEQTPRNESFRLCRPGHAERLLEYPHFTRPASFRGLKVPDVLLSGDHAAIAMWREQAALARTRSRRPDLLGDCFDKAGPSSDT